MYLTETLFKIRSSESKERKNLIGDVALYENEPTSEALVLNRGNERAYSSQEGIQDPQLEEKSGCKNGWPE